MKNVKWVCRTCNTVTVSPKAGPQRCFVCGTLRRSERLEPTDLPLSDEDAAEVGGAASLVPAEEPALVTPAPPAEEGPGLLSRLRSLLDTAGRRTGAAARETAAALRDGAGTLRERTRGWLTEPAPGPEPEVECSPDDSREAYVRVKPAPAVVEGTARTLPDDTAGRTRRGRTAPAERPSRPAPEPARTEPAPARPAGYAAPRPADRIRWNEEKLRASQYVAARAAVKDGVEGYTLTRADGSERFLRVQTLCSLQFAQRTA